MAPKVGKTKAGKAGKTLKKNKVDRERSFHFCHRLVFLRSQRQTVGYCPKNVSFEEDGKREYFYEDT